MKMLVERKPRHSSLQATPLYVSLQLTFLSFYILAQAILDPQNKWRPVVLFNRPKYIPEKYIFRCHYLVACLQSLSLFLIYRLFSPITFFHEVFFNTFSSTLVLSPRTALSAHQKHLHFVVLTAPTSTDICQ